jgi:replicative DNA helicase
MDKGKIQPQSIEIEQAILGAILVDKEAINEVGDILVSEMFYYPANRLIYDVITELHSTSSNIDLLTIADKLNASGNLKLVGGDMYLMDLITNVATTSHIESHVEILTHKYVQRQLIQKSTETINNAYNDEVNANELLSRAYNGLNSISEKSVRTQDASLADLIDAQVDHGQMIFAGEVKAGIPTPIHKLTEKTGGWRNSELIILAARPGMGKTAFAVSCVLEAAKLGIPAAFFSLEMSKEQLTDRILSMEARVESDRFNIRGLNDHDVAQISTVQNELKALPLYIDDGASLTITQFQVKAKRLKNKYDIGFIVVDYLQLMSGEGKGTNREQEISKISRGLKMVAKELNIPIMALSQLSRAVETRGGSKRPLLSDLRESGAIEQDADVVMFQYRPEYYGQTEWDEEYNREPTKGECEYIVAKNRKGALVRNRMRFEGQFTLFSDLEPEEWQTCENTELTNPTTDEAF